MSVMAIVCRPVAGLRSSPTPRSELLTQEIFGRRVEARSEGGDWVRCRLADGYEGWMAAGALREDAAKVPSHILIRRFARATSDGRGDLMLPMGAHLTVEETGKDHAVFSLPGGGKARTGHDALCALESMPLDIGRFEEVIGQVMGTPYLWGGKSTFGTDCSGLVQLVFEFFGYDLPRDSGQQALAGEEVGELRDLRPLDLLFFGDGDAVDHVGIPLGDLSMVHASGHVRIESLRDTSDLFSPGLLDRFNFARRILDA